MTRLYYHKLCLDDKKIKDLLSTIELRAQNGLAGRNGLDGLRGLDGLNGLDGLRGLNGENGFNGLRGLDGENGFNGLNGLNGLDGLRGLDGRQGPPGLPGPKGEKIQLIFTDDQPRNFNRFIGIGSINAPPNSNFFLIAYVISQRIDITRMKIALFVSQNLPGNANFQIDLFRVRIINNDQTAPTSFPSAILSGNIAVHSSQPVNSLYTLTVSTPPITLAEGDLVAVRLTNNPQATTKLSVAIS